MDSLMMLAEISAINSSGVRTEKQATASRSSTPSILSDDKGNFSTKSVNKTVEPIVLPMTIEQEYGESKDDVDYLDDSKESLEVSEPGIVRLHSKDACGTLNTSSLPFPTNELLLAKFKRPKSRHLATKPTCTQDRLQTSENLNERIFVPQAAMLESKTTKKTETEDMQQEAPLFKDQFGGNSATEKVPTDIKVILQEAKADSHRVLSPKTDANRTLFPIKLLNLLNNKNTDTKIITWAEDGKSFLIFNIDQFTEAILPHVFNQTSFASFQRQLNLYGFKRVTKAGPPAERSYFHELFLREAPEFCSRIRRNKPKSAATNTSASDSDSVSATETGQSRSSSKKQKASKSARKTRSIKRKLVPKIELPTNISQQAHAESNEDSTESKPKIPRIKNPLTAESKIELPRNIEAGGYTQWLAALSQDALHRANKPQLPNMNGMVPTINHLLNSSLSNRYAAQAPLSLLQLHQKREQLLGNIGINLQLPNSGNMLNTMNHPALNASNINFMKSLLQASAMQNQDIFNTL